MAEPGQTLHSSSMRMPVLQEGVVMFGENWLRIASGIALLFATVMVVAQSMLRNEWGNQLYYGTSLIAVFAYLFLSSRTKEKDSKEDSDSPWWW
jgi:hypothetical protein